MQFSPCALAGVWQIALELREDDRGFFARTYCETEFIEHGLNTHWPQCNLTLTRRRGMVRGLHLQGDPKPEIKLIRCTVGAVFDVVLDVRPNSPTFGKWAGVELTAQNRLALYVPGGFAHGFQCLSDDCEVYYQMSERYYPELARGVRWNDPAVNVQWPLDGAFVSERDQGLPMLSEFK